MWDNENKAAMDVQLTTIGRETSLMRLKRQREELEARLAKINRLEVLLQENPMFEELLNLTREVL